MSDEAMMWMNFAEMDLGVAKYLNESYHPKPLEIICYHCEQAAEKAIKSVWSHTGTPHGVSKTHNLSFLLEQMKNMVDIPEVCYDWADALTPYGIAVRYPNEIFVDEHHVTDAIQNADCLVKWAKKILEWDDGLREV